WRGRPAALALSTPKPPAAMRHSNPQSASHPLPIPPRKGEGVRSGMWHAPVPTTGRHLPPCGGGWEGGRRTLRATFSHGGEEVPRLQASRFLGLLPSAGEGARRADEGGYRSARDVATYFLRLLLLALALLLFATPTLAQTDDATLTALVDALAPGNFRDREAAAAALAATGDARAVPVLETLLEGNLYAVEASGKVVFVRSAGSDYALT